MLALLVVSIISLAAIVSNGQKVTVPEVLGAHGYDFTDNSYISAKLQDLFDLLPYSDYPYFTTTGNVSCGNSVCAKCNGRYVSRYHPMLKDIGIVDEYDSYSCFAFARYAYYYIYGYPVSGLNYFGNETGTLKRVGRLSAPSNDRSKIVGEYDIYTYETLVELMGRAMPGDIVQARTLGGVNHSMVFLGVDESGIYVIHDNAFSSYLDSEGNYYGNNRVLISYYTYERFGGIWNSILTVYRAPKSVFEEAWDQGYDICDEHEYREKDGDICINCGTKFQRTISLDCAGLYKVSGTKTIYSDAYASSNKIGSVSGNVTIVSSEINSIGEKWYRLAGDGYIKDGDITKVSNSKTLTISMSSYPIGKNKLYFSFSLRGRIISEKDEITKVSGYIVNSAGKTLQSATLEPNAQTVDIATSDINYKLRFGSLNLGEYKLIITAADGDGCNSVFIAPFIVDAEGETIKKEDKAAPAALDAEKAQIMDSYVLLEYVYGYEYSKDGKNWQDSNLFTNLEFNTEYTFYCRWAETTTTYASPKSDKLIVRTLKEQVAAQRPTLDGAVGDRTVKLVAIAEHEYSMDGSVWQESPVFTGLTPGTNYVFFQRDKDVKMPSAGLVVTTLKSIVDAPEAPTILGLSDTTITIQYNSDCEYAICEAKDLSAEIEWQDKETFKGEFTGLLPAREYYIYCRYSETDMTYASKLSAAAKERTDKTTTDAIPEIPVILFKNSSSITLVPVPGCEYSLDGEEFQESNVFTDLAPCMVYEVFCRYAETETTYPGECSETLLFEIIPDFITSESYIIDEEKRIIAGVENGTTVSLLRELLDQGKYATMKNSEGILSESTVVSTGDEVVINDISGTVASYTIVVKGDIDSNGKTDLTDMLIVLAMLSAEEYSHDIRFYAADMNSDGYVNSIDYALIHAKCLGIDVE